MTETKPKRFHHYKPVDTWMAIDRLTESLQHREFVLWRRNIANRPSGFIAFAPEAK